jgi:hypothetical protein
MVVLVMIGGFGRLRVDGHVSGAGACGTRAATGGGFPGRQFHPLSFSCFVIVLYFFGQFALCVYNLVIGSRPECVTDSLFM